MKRLSLLLLLSIANTNALQVRSLAKTAKLSTTAIIQAGRNLGFIPANATRTFNLTPEQVILIKNSFIKSNTLAQSPIVTLNKIASADFSKAKDYLVKAFSNKSNSDKENGSDKQKFNWGKIGIGSALVGSFILPTALLKIAKDQQTKDQQTEEERAIRAKLVEDRKLFASFLDEMERLEQVKLEDQSKATSTGGYLAGIRSKFPSMPSISLPSVPSVNWKDIPSRLISKLPPLSEEIQSNRGALAGKQLRQYIDSIEWRNISNKAYADGKHLAFEVVPKKVKDTYNSGTSTIQDLWHWATQV